MCSLIIIGATIYSSIIALLDNSQQWWVVPGVLCAPANAFAADQIAPSAL
jgi:hypothetical protein